jgi:type VI secretion system protein ImpJ
MATTTPLPDSVQWSEGMLLSPQHFQQNDIYWHSHLRHRMQALTPHYWGLQHMDYSLTDELISIRTLKCILSDGLAFDYPGNDYPGKYSRKESELLELKVGALCTVGAAPVRVWLWVRTRGPGAARQNDNERRYNSIGDLPTADENTGDGMLPIERLQVHAELYIGDAPPPSESAMPLLELRRGVNREIVVTQYHPPLLHLAASDFHQNNSLQQLLNKLHDQLWSKAKQLAGPADDAQSGQEHNLSDESRQHLTAARHLCSSLPQLALALDPLTHPCQAYQAVAQVVGQVACIGTNPMPLQMKPYRHDNCLPQFQAAIDYIDAKLALVDTAYESLPFARFDKHDSRQAHQQFACFARRLQAGMDDNLIVELKTREGQTNAQMLSWLQNAIIASEALMPQLLRSRLQGAQVRALNANEIKQHQLRPQAALFMLQNQSTVPHEGGLLPAFAAEQSLLIQGKKDANLPDAIILYRKKTSAPNRQADAGGKDPGEHHA